MTALDRMTGGLDTARVPAAVTEADQRRRAETLTEASVYMHRRGHTDLLDALGIDGPRRIQLRRTDGWTLPDNTIVVGGHTRWANPYRPGRDGITSPTAAVEAFRDMLGHHFAGRSGWPDYPTLAEIRAQLGGRNLGCWCPLPAPGEMDICHARLLILLANSGVRNAA